MTGDGEMLMGIGSLGSAAVRAPENLTVLVLDTGHFGETGMQRSHSGSAPDSSTLRGASESPTAERSTPSMR